MRKNVESTDSNCTQLPLSDIAAIYKIYQLKDTPESRPFLFMPLRSLEAKQTPVLLDRYECVYSGVLASKPESQTDQKALDALFSQFNMNRPQDFKGHSLSVSDVVVIEREGCSRAYYVDVAGFIEIPSFCPQHEPMRKPTLFSEQKANPINSIIKNLTPNQQVKVQSPHSTKGIQPPKHRRDNDPER